MKKLSETNRQFLRTVERLRSEDTSWPDIARELREPQTTIYDRYQRLKLRELQEANKEKGAGVLMS